MFTITVTPNLYRRLVFCVFFFLSCLFIFLLSSKMTLRAKVTLRATFEQNDPPCKMTLRKKRFLRKKISLRAKVSLCAKMSSCIFDPFPKTLYFYDKSIYLPYRT